MPIAIDSADWLSCAHEESAIARVERSHFIYLALMALALGTCLAINGRPRESLTQRTLFGIGFAKVVLVLL